MKTTLLKVLLPAFILGFACASCDTSTDAACSSSECSLPNGECVDDQCVCMPGYEGENCQTEQRQAFLGTYTVNESCDNGTDSYQMVVSAGEFAFNVVFENLVNTGANVVGVVSGNNVLINAQTFDLGGGNSLFLSGTGSIAGSELSLSCTIYENGGNADVCTMTCTK